MNIDVGYPKLEVNKQEFILRFCAPHNEEIYIDAVPVVLDLDEDKNVVGIEIINLKYKTGCVLEEFRWIRDDMKISYDNSNDAFYYKLNKVRSREQKEVLGRIILAENRMMVGINCSVIAGR